MSYFMNIPPLFLGTSGGWEWVIIFLVILLLFGAKRLPELARGLGKGIREFKHAIQGVEKELDDVTKTTENEENKSDSLDE